MTEEDLPTFLVKISYPKKDIDRIVNLEIHTKFKLLNEDFIEELRELIIKHQGKKYKFNFYIKNDMTEKKIIYFIRSHSIAHHETYLGKRKYRGLFISKEGIKLNADCNGGGNIIRKVFPNAFADGIQGVVVRPTRVNPYKLAS